MITLSTFPRAQRALQARWLRFATPLLNPASPAQTRLIAATLIAQRMAANPESQISFPHLQDTTPTVDTAYPPGKHAPIELLSRSESLTQVVTQLPNTIAGYPNSMHAHRAKQLAPHAQTQDLIRAQTMYPARTLNPGASAPTQKQPALSLPALPQMGWGSGVSSNTGQVSSHAVRADAQPRYASPKTTADHASRMPLTLVQHRLNDAAYSSKNARSHHDDAVFRSENPFAHNQRDASAALPMPKRSESVHTPPSHEIAATTMVSVLYSHLDAMRASHGFTLSARGNTASNAVLQRAQPYAYSQSEGLNARFATPPQPDGMPHNVLTRDNLHQPRWQDTAMQPIAYASRTASEYRAAQWRHNEAIGNGTITHNGAVASALAQQMTGPNRVNDLRVTPNGISRKPQASPLAQTRPATQNAGWIAFDSGYALQPPATSVLQTTPRSHPLTRIAETPINAPKTMGASAFSFDGKIANGKHALPRQTSLATSWRTPLSIGDVPRDLDGFLSESLQPDYTQNKARDMTPNIQNHIAISGNAFHSAQPVDPESLADALGRRIAAEIQTSASGVYD